MNVEDILLATLVVVIWGGNFVAAKIGMQYLPPILYTAMRFAAVALLLLPFLKKLSKAQFRHIVLLAAVLGTLHFSLLFGSLRAGLSIPAAILVAQLCVPFSCLLGTYFFGDKLGVWRTLGMALSFFGLALVAGTPDITQNMFGFFLIVAGAFSWGAANVIMKKMGKMHVLQVFGWMAIFSVPMLLVSSLLIESSQLHSVLFAPPAAWYALIYTVVFSTLLAYGIWYPLVQKHDISHLAPFNLISPVVGIGLGQVFFREPLSWQILLGGAITLAGVSIIVLRRPKNLALSKET